MRFTAGDRVSVRGERWIVEEATAYADSTLLDLSSAGRSAPAPRCQVLVPFDRPVATHRVPAMRVVTARRWARCLRAHLSEARVHGQLRAARRALLTILPFQLEPALALIQRRATRYLLADEVGLGKTVQAGLMLAELRQRGWCDRALVLAPSGLRQQWAGELQQRFAIPSLVIDAPALSALSSSLPLDVNPWAVEPVAIASLDFVKQPEVLRALATQLWDLVIVDEAHQAAVAEQRHEAVRTIAARARHVVLVTATPHAGDDQAFRALCALGQFDAAEPLVLFRRTRANAGLPRRRRVHLLGVRLTAEAMDMHRRLDAYLAQLWQIAQGADRRDARLVAMVLAKRAFSSARSLAQSLERRLAALTEPDAAPSQQSLPFDADCDSSDEPLMPQTALFDRVGDEQDVLRHLLDAARRAEAADRKMHALARLLRRIPEPVIVFTEYRDTLGAMAAAVGDNRTLTMIHGGQTALERRESIAAFTSGAADVLLATDAGAEGLNLHTNCRVVVNLELPWNPIRLEQRIGRVDRIGQTRTVHAMNLLAAGTAEDGVLARLQQRLECMRMSEIEVAACVINRSEPVPRQSHEAACTTLIDMREAAKAEARRLSEARTIEPSPAALSEWVVPVTVLHRRGRRHVPGALRPGVIAFMRIRLVTGAGRLIEDTLVPVRVPLGASMRRARRREIRAATDAFIATAHPHLVRVAREHALRRAESITLESAASGTGTIARAHGIAHRAAACRAPLVQAGLFDTRAVRQHSLNMQRHEAIRGEGHARARLIDADSRVRLSHDPEMVLILVLC